MNKKEEKIVIILSVIAALVVAFLIYWKATEHNRYIKGQIAYVKEEISAYRNGEQTDLYFFTSSAPVEDPTYLDFLLTQVTEFIDNEEYRLLAKFLHRLEFSDSYIQEIREVITNSFNNADNLKTIWVMKEELKYLDYYNVEISLSRDSAPITSYIELNGIEEITTTPGTGYYANETDYSSKNVVGLPTSPLYDAESVTYMGDFEITHQYGVKLNSYYEETSYSTTLYAFRGNLISFSPNNGDCIYSGEYLFCFSKDGELIVFEKISKK